MRSKRKKCERIFIDAILKGDAATVKEMLSVGVSVEARTNEHGETALMLAVLLGRDAVTVLLLEAGADVNAIDATGRTPLMFAKAQYVPVLLTAGAHINMQSEDGAIALIKAAASADIDKVKDLLENGADPTLADHDSRSAWDYANDSGVLVLMDLLEPGHRSKQGKL